MKEQVLPFNLARQDVRELFPTPLIVADIEDAPALNDSLREVVLRQKALSKGLERSNILGWHSDNKMLRWGGEPARRLGKTMMQLCGRYTNDAGAKDGASRFRMAIEMWANISPAGSSNQYHAHPSCLWSGVYYVDDGGDPEGGPLVLLDPRFPMNKMYYADLAFMDEKGAQQNTKERILPTPGRMVIFPSWLMHGVRPHSGPRDRISIAMNLAAFPLMALDSGV